MCCHCNPLAFSTQWNITGCLVYDSIMIQESTFKHGLQTLMTALGSWYLKGQFNHYINLLFPQEQASIGCHIPICTVSQTKLEVCAILCYWWNTWSINDIKLNFHFSIFLIVEVLYFSQIDSLGYWHIRCQEGWYIQSVCIAQ